MLWVVPTLFAGSLAVTSLLSRGDRSSASVSASLWVVWALANAAWFKDMLWVLPILDLGLGMMLMDLWWKTQARWVDLILRAAAIRLILHVLYAITGHLFFVAYAHALNATFAWMIVVVATSGGDHGTIADRFRDLRRCILLSRRPPAACKEIAHGR